MKLILLKDILDKYKDAYMELYKLEQLEIEAYEIHEDYYALNKKWFDEEKQKQKDIIHNILMTDVLK